MKRTSARKSSGKEQNIAFKGWRVMFVFLLCSSLACIAAITPVTWAWFSAEVSNWSTIRFASFRADAALTLMESVEPIVVTLAAGELPPAMQTAAADEDPVETALSPIHSQRYSAGVYQLSIPYSGTTGGYCLLVLTPAGGTAGSAAYAIRLSATDGADAVCTRPLVLNESANVTLYADWGDPDPALTLLDEEGIAYGEVPIRYITAVPETETADTSASTAETETVGSVPQNGGEGA